MPEPHFTLTGLAPAGILADLEAAGFSGPYKPDDKAAGLVTDRGDHSVVLAFPGRSWPDLRTKLAALLCAVLNGLTEEARAARDPLDPAHLDAAAQESRRNLARLDRNRPEAAE